MNNTSTERHPKILISWKQSENMEGEPEILCSLLSIHRPHSMTNTQQRLCINQPVYTQPRPFGGGDDKKTTTLIM